ncbi:S-layer homology domain-containing protein [Thiolapillus sp.]
MNSTKGISAILMPLLAAASASSMAGKVLTSAGWVDEGQVPEAVAAAPVVGNTPDTVEPKAYGTTDEGISVVPWISFRPRDSSVSYSFSGAGPNKVCITGGDDILYAAFPDDIPDGALVTQVIFYGYDNDATDDLSGQLHAYYADSGNGNNWGVRVLVTTPSTSGTPGHTVSYKNFAQLIDRRQDIDSDGTMEVVSYMLVALTGKSGNVCVNQARILWKRQVSPAPATATFSDVPTTHQFFREIEALADSGITSGCSATQYCPDDPVTRGQMAVFLAKGLGLHWPYN